MKFLLLFLFLVIGFVGGYAQATSKKLKAGVVVHTVYFWLKNKGNQQDLEALYQGIKTLVPIKEIQTAYIGTPADTKDRPVIDGSYDLSITWVFKNTKDQDAYQIHPIHLKFVEEKSHLWERVVVYDALSK
ncbi:MAG: Dabb family protein [Haliscomenobacter sp.]|nr:Dabb family protein [Haliscomenobacter sp.]MBK9491100.1 Dabb family protein [Haliscomenobacter sp.]